MNGFPSPGILAVRGIVAQTDMSSLLRSPISWGLALGGLGLWALLVGRSQGVKGFGSVVGALGLATTFVSLPKLSALETRSQWAEQVVFWLLAAVAVVCAAAAVTSRKPVYTAIWFAGSLLGVAGLFLFQNAQFLGVATIVVYAGAIVVTFLFVLMLANSEGHTPYDRVSWGNLVVPATLVAALILVVSVAGVLDSPPQPSLTADASVNSGTHMAYLGAELFARHLVSVEVAATILLVALVGAVAIVIQGKQRRASVAAAPVGSRTDVPREEALR